MDATSWDRFQFGFLALFHYLFPALTMGLALVVFLLKFIGYKTGDSGYTAASRFWAKIFGVNFAVGVVTGIPLEFQFGTNWARFSNFSGGVIGLTLAMEGMFAFFAESVFLGLFLYGEKRLSKKAHLFSSFMVFAGSWLSGYFIIATNAFMQHPVGYVINPDGRLGLSDAVAYVFNPWGIWQWLHTEMASVITACFVVAAAASYYTLSGKHKEVADASMKVAITTGLIASILVIFPTGDGHGKMLAKYQPASLAAMEGRFSGGTQAGIALIGQPDVPNQKIDNSLAVPSVLSYLAYGSFGADVKGMNEFKKEDLPDNIELLYFSYHIMAGLGTVMILLLGTALYFLKTGTLFGRKPLLWILMFAFPLPYIATTMGWLTTELGRQPWLIYGIQRTHDGTSSTVSGGNVAFTALGFMGLYMVVGVLFLYLVYKLIAKGRPQESQVTA